MDDLRRVHEIWQNEAYMDALTETWKLSGLYSYREFYSR